MKWIGAACLLVGFGYIGFSAAHTYRKETRILRQICMHLEFMICQLEYQQTPLPQLFRLMQADADFPLDRVFMHMYSGMEQQISPDPFSCMVNALEKVKDLPKLSRAYLLDLGRSLGRFDLSGQLRGAEAVLQQCKQTLHMQEENRDLRIRSYQVFGLCAGVALIIILI